jgi:hypothetical protein
LTRPLRPIRWVPATTRYSDSSSRERPRPIRGRKGSTPLVLLRLLIRWCSLARWIILALFPLLFSFSLSFFFLFLPPRWWWFDIMWIIQLCPCKLWGRKSELFLIFLWCFEWYCCCCPFICWKENGRNQEKLFIQIICCCFTMSELDWAEHD